jgi:hypothetical protein
MELPHTCAHGSDHFQLATLPADAGAWLERGAPARHLVFVLDCTGSMGAWIAACKGVISGMLRAAASNAAAERWVATLVLYRDHPQGAPGGTFNERYVTRTVGPTDSLATLQAELDATDAIGGGDGPEAVAEALRAAADAIAAAAIPNAKTVRRRDLARGAGGRGALPGALRCAHACGYARTRACAHAPRRTGPLF